MKTGSAGRAIFPRLPRRILPALCVLAIAGCDSNDLPPLDEGPFPPGPDLSKPAVDGLEVGHRLMAAGQYELALDAFTRAALEQGLTSEIVTAMGTANLGLGRLGQAEDLLRRAVREEPERPEAWNNLGVLLMEKGETIEAEQVFRRAFALDNGESDSIRDNLRLALEKNEKPDNLEVESQEYKLVRRGNSDFLIRRTP